MTAPPLVSGALSLVTMPPLVRAVKLGDAVGGLVSKIDGTRGGRVDLEAEYVTACYERAADAKARIRAIRGDAKERG